MWVILFLCVSVILGNNAQELPSFKTNATSYPYSTANGVSEGSPITLRIWSGRNEDLAQNSDIPPKYSLDWKSLTLVPAELNSNVDSDKHENGNVRSAVTILPILYQRPDSQANNTLLSQLIRRNEVSSTPESILYLHSNPNTTSDILTSSDDQVTEQNPNYESTFTNSENSQDYDLYGNAQSFIDSRVFYNPYHSTLNSNAESFKRDVEEKQLSLSGDQRFTETVPNESIPIYGRNVESFDLYRNSQNFSPPRVSFYNPSEYSLYLNNENSKSDVYPMEISSSAIAKSTNSDLITTEESIKPLSTEDHRAKQIIPTPSDFYRNQRFLPQVVPAYNQPYSFHTYQRGGTFQPMVPYLPNSETFDREAGFGQRIPEVPEKQSLSRDVPGHLNENLSSETAVHNILPTLPYPTREYPFGLYLSPYVSPMIRNFPQSGIHLNPQFLQARNAPKENIIAAAPPPPLVPINPVPNIVPPIPPQIDELTPKAEPSVTVVPEVVPVAEPNPSKTPYAFGFDMNDGKGNDQHRKEVSDISGVVTGSYGFKLKDGSYRYVMYEADENGFRAFVHSNEQGVASSGSADVVVVAERAPPKAIPEGDTEVEFVTVPDPKSNLITAGSFPELR